MSKIPMLEKFAAQSLVEVDGELIFSKEKFAELIVRECQFAIVSRTDLPKHERKLYNKVLKDHFGVEE